MMPPTVLRERPELYVTFAFAVFVALVMADEGFPLPLVCTADADGLLLDLVKEFALVVPLVVRVDEIEVELNVVFTSLKLGELFASVKPSAGPILNLTSTLANFEVVWNANRMYG